MFNAFVRSLHTEHGHALIRLPSIKVEKRIIPTYSAEHVQKIMDCRPTNTNHQRVKALWVLAIDTGCRIHELLALSRQKINLDQCALTVFGNGRKERVVPFSAEGRKALYEWLKTHERPVFSTRAGFAITARNAARDLGTLLDHLHLTRPKRLWHSTRRTFRTTYIRNGGDVFRLHAALRVSGKGQVEGDGFPRQLAAIKAYAKTNDTTIVNVFREEGVSGARESMDRRVWADMLVTVRSTGVRAIVIEKLDRLARDLMVQQATVADLRRQGITLVSVHEPDLMANDPARVVSRQMMGVFAQYDKSQIVLKLRRARMRKRATHARCEDRKPFGHYDGEADVLGRMKALRAGGV